MKRGSLVIISTILVIIGLILLVSSLSLTGNVVSNNIGKTTGSILGLAFIIGGFVLFVVQTRTSVKYHLKPLEDILKEAGTPGKSIFVLDSSGAIDYKNKITEVLRKYPGGVYVPDEIMKELGRDFRQRYRGRIKTIRNNQYGKYSESARKRLEQTPKHRDYLLYLKGKKARLNPREHERLVRKMEKIRRNLKGEGGEEPPPKKVEDYIEKSWKVSRGDISLLATAINAARHRKKVNILAEDTHIRDAIADIKRRNKKLGQYINYVDYRRYAA